MGRKLNLDADRDEIARRLQAHREMFAHAMAVYHEARDISASYATFDLNKAAKHAAILVELRHMLREREAAETFTEGE